MKLTLYALGLFLYLLSMSALAQDTASEWLEKGKQSNDPTEQILFFSKAIKIDENLEDAYYRRGLARMKRELISDAVQDFEVAISLSPKPMYFASRGEAYLLSDQYREAIQDLNEAIRAKPHDTKLYLLRGEANHKAGLYEAASKDFDEVLRKIPSDSKALNGKGRVLLDKKDFENALTYFESALKYNPQNLEARVNIAAYYANKKDWGKAILQYDQVLAINKNFKPAILGKSKAEQGKKNQRISTPERTVEMEVNQKDSDLVFMSTLKRKYALLIGNSKYQYYDNLRNLPVNDATDMKRKLDDLGFDTTLITDVGFEALTNALTKFYQKIENADVALVFYAGHGLEFNKENYFVPVDKSDITVENAQFKAIQLQRIQLSLNEKNVNYSIIVADACRSSRGIGLATVSVPAGSQNYYIAYATSSGKVADNGNGRNGVYTQELLKNIQRGRRVDDTFIKTRANVMNLKGKEQMPEFLSGVNASLVF